MKKYFFHTAIIFSFILTLFAVSASAQTLTLNDGAILQSNTNRAGINIGAIDYWDTGQILKNLIGSSNPGMEPLQNRQIWSLATPGTTTTFTVPDIYDTVPANYWTGGTFTVVDSQSGGAELGCTGTIASNTGPNYPLASVVTWSAPSITAATACSAPFSVGDIVLVTKTTFPTPESWWESGSLGGTSGSVIGGGQLLSDTTDLCATCGTQALNMNASASSTASATAAWYFDTGATNNIFVLMNGTYQLSFWAKLSSGTPKLTVTASRGTANGFNCGTYSPQLTTTWAQYTWTCTASETAAGTAPANAQVVFQTTGGSVYLDNVSFEKTSGNQANTTVLRDEVIEALQKYYGPSNAGNPGTLRYWVNQNGETMSNWSQPDYAHAPSGGGTSYFVAPGGSGPVSLSLEDYLEICQYLNAIPYLEVPVTFTQADAANLIEFLASPAGTTYGTKRANLGQSEPWTSVFSTIHLAFCNECWNSISFDGQNLPDRASQPNAEGYYDYSVRARDIFSAMRADSYYPASGIDLVMGAQTAVNYSMDAAINRAHPDSIEIADYTYGSLNLYATDAEIWQPAMVDPYEKVTNPQDYFNFYQSLHDYQSQTTCGPNGKTQCKVNIYEWGQGTISGTTDQTHLDIVNAGAGEGVVMALQPLLNMQYFGIQAQSFFALTEFDNPVGGGLTAKLWGNTVDMGGATNNVRPEFLGVQLINQSVIGPMYSCPISSSPTYTFPGSVNGSSGMPALANVPYLYAFCFENGSSRSLVLINTDLSNPHTLTFAGSNTPTGAVTQRQYAPSSLDAMNEAPTGTASNHSPAAVAIETSSLSSPSSITLPPYSVTALDYSATTTQAAAMPSFSPGSGTYAGTQSVSILDTTPGSTIYYTTDGSTPTTSSNVYSAPISVSAAETVQALAVTSGYSNSPVGSASYIISPILPTPTFSVATGTYPTTQTVTISEAQSGATVYYTTNGTTPTTSSSVYSGPITVSATETLEAIAVEASYTNSATATSTITIAPQLPAPTFSEAAGTFTSPQSIRLSTSASGSLIYYTLDGSTPTTSSNLYSGSLWVANNTTIKAITAEAGYSTSPVVSGTFLIAPLVPTPTFNLSGGTWPYTGAQNLVVSESLAGASIYYTTNGSTPTTASTLYTGPITVSSTETVNVIAAETNYTNSPVASVLITISGTTATLPAPTFSVAPGTYATAQTVTLADSTAGTTIYYTTNGTTPTTSSAVYSGAITVSSTETLEAIAVKTGSTNSPAASATYTITTTLPAPSFSVAGGTYSSGQTVSISDANATATIYYTTNGTTPTTSSSVYSGPIAVSASETLQAIASATGYVNSAPATATYTINPALTAPTFSVAAGTYTTTQTVTLSDATSGATIYYTTNGSTPTTSSSVYSGAITVSATETLEAIAVKPGYTTSTAASATYTINPVLTAPTFSVAAGTYSSSQSVTLSDATSGATIYYTTNGSTPTTSSSVYSGAITVSATETLEAIAVKPGYTTSTAASATYTISSALPAPTFSVAPGTYTGPQSVHITDSAANAIIYYTTDGSTPTSASTQYGGALWISKNETVKAIAIASGYTNSPVATGAFLIAPVIPTPTFSLAGGVWAYQGAQSLTISDSQAGTTMYYTTNGSTPTTASTKYTGPITVSATETVNVIATETNYTNSTVASLLVTIAPTLTAPTFSPAPGSYTSAQTVTISDATAGTTIYYTTNGTTPTTASTVYSGAVTVGASETLQAIAAKTGYVTSAVGTGAYTIVPVLPAPAFSLASGSYAGSQSVTLSDATAGTTIYYTTNDTTPTTASTKYSGAITVATTETVKAIAVKTGFTTSTAATAVYTINSTGAALAAPVPSVPGGAYVSAQTVTLSDATVGAYIFYTTNGTVPTASSTRYTGPITVSKTETVRAIAEKTGSGNSPVTTVAYTIASVLPEPTFSKAAGNYGSAQTVTLSDSHAGATICFTVDGSTPTAASSKYTGPIIVSGNETIKAIAIDSGYINSPVASAEYSIYATLPAPKVSIAAGTYSTALTVTISDAAVNSIVYYTTNGTMPTTSATRYTGAIKVSASEVVAAIAVESGFTTSPALIAKYTIETAAATPASSLAVGTYAAAQTVTLTDATTGAVIYYTTNGTTPTTASTKYTAPIKVTATETIKAIAVATGHTNSAVASVAYTIAPAAATPAASLAAGMFASSQTVTLTDATAGATIYYTTNGATPTTASTKYTAPIKVTATETIKAIAVLAGHTNSEVKSVTYTIETAAAIPATSLAVGTYTSAQTVALTDATAGATIYYTTNGTTPTTASTKYTAPIKVTATETIKAIAVLAGHTNSEVKSVTYTIETAAAAPAFSVAAGTFTSAQTIKMTDATADAKIYYTTNGTAPTSSSTLYKEPVTVSASETLKAIAIAPSHTVSAIKTSEYKISAPKTAVVSADNSGR